MRVGLMSDAWLALLRDKFPTIETLLFDAAIDGQHTWQIGPVIRVPQRAVFPNLRHLTLANCYFSPLTVYGSAVWPTLESITLCGRTKYSPFDYLGMSTFLGLAAWCAETEADSTLGGPPRITNFQLEDGAEIPVASDDDARFTDSDAVYWTDSSSEADSSSGDHPGGDDGGALLTVNGPDWNDDDSENDGSWESTDSEDGDSEDGDSKDGFSDLE
ncbi:hypothetical protein AURDEDRAFT_160176 [Auricularia subglabra TFB-10046 SS5]|nr:hypothetical protein AURDEDRAFT_160176 [Auricularia subglabra TFB-10046 SS5]